MDNKQHVIAYMITVLTKLVNSFSSQMDYLNKFKLNMIVLIITVNTLGCPEEDLNYILAS